MGIYTSILKIKRNKIVRIRELFKSTTVPQSIGGLAIFLDREDYKILNKTKNENSIVLHLEESPAERKDEHICESKINLRI